MHRLRLSSRLRIVALGAAAVPIVAASLGAGPTAVTAKTTTRAASSTTSSHGLTRMVSGSAGGGASASTATSPAGVQNPETPPIGGDGTSGSDRSHSGPGSTPVGAVKQTKTVTTSTPGLMASFDGLNHYTQRWGEPNQFSLEPPDQGLCVGTDGNGNTRILEVLNDVMRVYNTSGGAESDPRALNAFLGYAPAIIRKPNPDDDIFGPFVTDPSCYYDATSGRWFVDVLTLDSFPLEGDDQLQHFTGINHIDLAVSDTSNPDPTAGWTVYRMDVQDDGTDGTPNDHCSAGTSTSKPLPTNPNACFGDYPHIGADASGIYITTNEYSFFGNEFKGAQVYAFSKSALLGTPGTVAVTQFDTHGMDTFGFALNGFTLWPSVTPGGGGDSSAGGTEYFLSTNAAAEAHDTGDGKSTAHPSTQLLVWALTGTGSMASGSAGTLSLSSTKLDVGTYAPPPPAVQKPGSEPLRDCLNNNFCAINFALGSKDPFSEKSAALDSNDTRMQQVTWVNGQLWGAIDTGVAVSSAKQAGIEWFDAAPSTATGSLTAALTSSGYVALGNDNLTYPAIGLTSGGTGVMAFTLVGSDFYPSAGYATVSSAGIGDIHIAGMGQGPDDGFTDYKVFGDTPGIARPRWGDYGAAVAWGNNIWMASEYIGQSCTLATYERTAGLCGQTRSALGNWDTRISEVAAP